MRCIVELHHRTFLCLFVFFSLLPASQSLAATWREVQSPHFRVVTDGSEHDGRDVAKEFEQMRSVFAVRFNNPAVEAGAPILVIAVRESGLQSLPPYLWKQREKVAGEFFPGWERQFAMVRLDTFGDLNQVVVFHEYAHSVLHANIHWLPAWLDDGMAEFYAYTRFQGDRILIGAPSIRLRHLKEQPLTPIAEILRNPNPNFGVDTNRADLFSGEAWLIVHYMTFGDNMGGGAKLNKFISLLETRTPQLEAFQQVFGDPKAFDKDLSIYESHFTMAAGVLPPLPKLETNSYSAKMLTAAETDYAIGSFDIGAHDHAAAAEHFRAAESADPALAGPHEELGFLAWRDGKDEEARAEWQKAVAADPSFYRSAFALLMTGTPLRDQTPQQLRETQTALEALKEKAPRFAPIFVQLAMVQWRLGSMNSAYKSSLEAERLEPWRAGYHLLTGHLLMNGHQQKLAGESSRLVASRWPGSDHDEAVDLWNLLPNDARGDGPPLTLSFPADATVVRGTIVSSVCDKGLSLVIQPEAVNAAPVKVQSSGRYERGFSDTLWVGRDHFTACFHIAGLQAVVAYKAEGTEPAKLLVLEVRDDLPDQKRTATAPTTANVAKPQPSNP